MLTRRLHPLLHAALAESPAVALLGPRQAGKTTLALQFARPKSSLYLDLESESDRARLAHPELFLTEHLDKLVILDEVHRAPGLFPVLRGLIDKARRQGRRSGLYLLLGSTSLDLLRQSGETLAGRIRYPEPGPIDAPEIGAHPAEARAARGGGRRWPWDGPVLPQAGADTVLAKLPEPVRELLLTTLAPAT